MLCQNLDKESTPLGQQRYTQSQSFTTQRPTLRTMGKLSSRRGHALGTADVHTRPIFHIQRQSIDQCAKNHSVEHLQARKEVACLELHENPVPHEPADLATVDRVLLGLGEQRCRLVACSSGGGAAPSVPLTTPAPPPPSVAASTPPPLPVLWTPALPAEPISVTGLCGGSIGGGMTSLGDV
jgi:hypothetical protein